jgi:hypothetical protein
MEEMIARWIRETRVEYEKSRLNQNFFKMMQMSKLIDSLKDIRDKLI